MRRRQFVALFGGAAAATWPFAARAQQPDRVRLIGVLQGLAADDPVGPARLAAFTKALEQLGWTDGRNVRFDYRWSGGNADVIRRQAGEGVALAPDVIFTAGSQAPGRGVQAAGPIPVAFAIPPR